MPHWMKMDFHARQPVCEGRGVMMGDYLARIRRDGSAGQMLPEHLGNVAELMAGFAEGSGLSATARLIGILHDLGKCTAEFSAYLDWCREHSGDFSRRGTVDHASAGGQLLRRRYGAHSEEGQLAADMAALVIFSHHSGLMNYVDKKGCGDFLRRVEKDDLLERVDLAYYYREVIGEEMLDRLFAEAVGEFSALDARIESCASEEMENYHFAWGMVHKLLFSMLVDADRLDSAEFELDVRLTQEWHTEMLWGEFSVNSEKTQGFSYASEGDGEEDCRASPEDQRRLSGSSAKRSGNLQTFRADGRRQDACRHAVRAAPCTAVWKEKNHLRDSLYFDH